VLFYRKLTAPGRGDALIGFDANNDDIGLTIFIVTPLHLPSETGKIIITKLRGVQIDFSARKT